MRIMYSSRCHNMIDAGECLAYQVSWKVKDKYQMISLIGRTETKKGIKLILRQWSIAVGIDEVKGS